MPKRIAGALQIEADIANTFDVPIPGVPTGSGVRTVIPADYLARIAARQDVSGCNYHRLQPVITFGTGVQTDTALVISDLAIGKVAIPAQVLTLTGPQQAVCPALATKISAGVVV